MEGEGGDMDQGCEACATCGLLEETNCYVIILRFRVTYLQVDYLVLGCDAMLLYISSLTFRSNLLSPSSGYLNPKETLSAVRATNPKQ